MPNPKKKFSRARRDSRRATYKAHPLSTSPCPNCSQPRLPHRVCTSCGYYKGRQIIQIKTA
ncbi:MAG: 50S ribosomal protein L32 [Chlamydiota bacterium]|nr:50S ribosomal protein L32 [Chlamydiota bacterium]